MASNNTPNLAIIDLATGIRTIVPSASPDKIAKLISRSSKVGITNSEQINEAIMVCRTYKKSFSNLLKWMETGLALTDVTQCIEYSDKLPEFTITMVCTYFKKIDFRVNFPDTVMETFSDFFSYLEGRYPANRLLHIIEDRFSDDILAAYHMAVDDPHRFIAILEGRTFSTSDITDEELNEDSEEDFRWTVDS